MERRRKTHQKTNSSSLHRDKGLGLGLELKRLILSKLSWFSRHSSQVLIKIPLFTVILMASPLYADSQKHRICICISFSIASSSLNFSLICQEMSTSKVFSHFLMPLAVKRLNNLPIMEVKYSLLKMHVSLNGMPFGSLQTLTTPSQSLGTQNGLGWPAAWSYFLSY